MRRKRRRSTQNDLDQRDAVLIHLRKSAGKA